MLPFGEYFGLFIGLRRLRYDEPRLSRSWLNIDPENHLREVYVCWRKWAGFSPFQACGKRLRSGLSNSRLFNAALLLETECTPYDLRATILRPIEQTLHRAHGKSQCPAHHRSRFSFIQPGGDDRGASAHPRSRYPHPPVRLLPPSAQIAPAYIHPETGQTLRDIAAGSRAMQETMKREDVRLWEPRGNE